MRTELSTAFKAKNTLLLTSDENYKKDISSLLKMFKTKGISGVYVTVNKPSENLLEEFNALGISDENMLIIDLVTELTGSKNRRKNCIYLQSPQSLTDLAIALDEVLKTMEPEEKFVIFDSISALLVHNPLSSVIQFSHFITNRMRSREANMVLIALYKELDEKTMSLLSQFCDQVIREE